MDTPGSTVWRDYETDGVPSSGVHEVKKSDVRAWSKEIEALADTASAITNDIQTGTTYTTSDDDLGECVSLNNAAAIAVTLHKTAADGFICAFEQAGAGQITFSAQSGATLRNRFTQSKTAAQWSCVGLRVRSNSDGNSAEWVLTGDTGD